LNSVSASLSCLTFDLESVLARASSGSPSTTESELTSRQLRRQVTVHTVSLSIGEKIQSSVDQGHILSVRPFSCSTPCMCPNYCPRLTDHCCFTFLWSILSLLRHVLVVYLVIAVIPGIVAVPLFCSTQWYLSHLQQRSYNALHS
jgi:hypothetical protein